MKLDSRGTGSAVKSGEAQLEAGEEELACGGGQLEPGKAERAALSAAPG